MSLLQPWLFLAGLVVAGVYLFYLWLLPRPIPGIPFVPESKNRLLGDLPAALAYQKDHGSLTKYLVAQCIKHNQPVMQFWLRPFDKPWVCVVDGQEANDIMTRRLKDFDGGSSMFRSLFAAYLTPSQLTFPTGHDWKYQRRLVSETMLPKFLHGIAAARSYEATTDLIDVLKQKNRLARGHTFEVKQDILDVAASAIWGITFGSDLGLGKAQIAQLASMESIDLPADDQPRAVEFRVAGSPIGNAIFTLLASSQICQQFGLTVHKMAIRFLPYLRNALATRDRIVGELWSKAWAKLTRDPATDDIRCALDLVLQREITTAKKEGREAMKGDVRERVHQELCAFITGGSGTTADSLMWMIKELSVQQDLQRKIRDHLQTTFFQQHHSRVQLTPDVITKYSNPYLDAFIQECLRFRGISTMLVRETTQNTRVLGHDIPKGNTVTFALTGPSYHAPAFPIPQSQRDIPASTYEKPNQRKWQHDDLDVFRAERWLVPASSSSTTEGGDNDDVTYDAEAAPMNTFGEGPRSCFGKRLAYQEMRMILIMMLWNFELRPIEPELMDFDVHEELTFNAKNCRVKLREIL